MFIDGENLVFRYQSMIGKGYVAIRNVEHIPDILVWQYSVYAPGDYDVLRANYYTYATGDENKISCINEKLKQLTFLTEYSTTLPRNLTPIVFKKPQKTAKAKGVDIQLTVDVLSYVQRDIVDAVFILTGDGDYEPLFREVQRCGKLIYHAAFSDGLSPTLRNLADQSYSLDTLFFEQPPK